MPQVTVIIPSYNHAAYLPACIESIQNQTFTDWQMILIDDGSTDDSVEIARTIAQSEPRLQVHQNPQNLGTYGTEQRGLDLSESQYVAIMNSDDVWSPGKLERQITQLEADPTLVLSYCLGSLIDDQGQEIPGHSVHADWPTNSPQNPLPWLLYENRILASGVLWRREVLRFETTCRYSGDWVALLEAATRGPFGCIPENLTFWRQHDTNSYRLSIRQAAEEIRVREAIHRQISSFRAHTPDWQRGYAQNLMNLTSLYAFFYQPQRARAALKTSLTAAPNKRQVLKRLAGSYLPIEKFRRHLWKADIDSFSREDLAKQFISINPLTFQI